MKRKVLKTKRGRYEVKVVEPIVEEVKEPVKVIKSTKKKSEE